MLYLLLNKLPVEITTRLIKTVRIFPSRFIPKEVCATWLQPYGLISKPANSVFVSHQDTYKRVLSTFYLGHTTQKIGLSNDTSGTNIQIRSLHTSGSKYGGQNANNEDNEGRNNQFKSTMLLLGVGLGIYLALTWTHGTPGSFFPNSSTPEQLDSKSVNWREFCERILPTGDVQNIVILTHMHDKAFVNLHGDHGTQLLYLQGGFAESRKIEQMLRKEENRLGIHPLHGIPVKYVDPPGFFTKFLLFITATLSLVALGLMVVGFMRRSGGGSGIMQQSYFKEFEKMKKKLDGSRDVIRPGSKKMGNVKFADVAGMTEAKQEVMEFVHFLQKVGIYKELGARMPRGCLLTGPPGVGKTLLAKAVASEANVPFIAKSGSDFVEMVGGLGARRIRQMFEDARAEAPCIIFIDELDAVGGARGSGMNENSEKNQTLNQLLVEMDGMLSKKHEVIVLASTNRSDMLDKALLRPGRFDRTVQIDLPTQQDRKEILEIHLAKIKLDNKPDIYSPKLAEATPGMSGADLANICNEAAIYAARNGDDTVTHHHLDYAIERVTAGSPKSSTTISPQERRVVATHESGHVLVGWLLKHTDALQKVTIIPRTKAALGFARTIPSDRQLYSPDELFDYMCMALGGRVAEELVFQRVTSGAADDLKKVTDMAYAQVKHFGFSDVIGHLSYQQQGQFQLKPFSNAMQDLMDNEVRKLVQSALAHTKELLQKNVDLLKLLSDELYQKESLSYEDVSALIGPPTHGHKKLINDIPFGPFSSEIEHKKE